MLTNATTSQPGIAGGLLHWLGLAAAGSSPAPARIGPKPGAVSGVAVEFTGPPGRQALVLSRDLQGLLGITGNAAGGAAATADATPFEPPPGPSRSARRAARRAGGAAPGAPTPTYIGLLNRHLATARAWLAQPQVQQALAARGLQAAQVQEAIGAQESWLRTHLAADEQQGRAAFGLVPSAHDIFQRALGAAQHARRLAQTSPPPPAALPAPLPAPPTVLPSTRPSPVPTAAPGESTAEPVAADENPVLRQQSLERVQRFGEKADQLLQDLRFMNWVTMPLLADGHVRYLHLADLIDSFPCASQSMALPPPPTEAGSPPAPGEAPELHLFYPDTYVDGRPRPLRSATVGNTSWQVMCGPDNRVKISRDGRQWIDTGIYTDPTVELEKQRTLALSINRAAYLVWQHEARRANLHRWQRLHNGTHAGQGAGSTG